MKHRFVTTVFLCAIAAVLLGNSMNVAAQKSVQVKIPFSFVVNECTLPAGEYRIHVVHNYLATFIDRQTGMGRRMMIIRPESQSHPSLSSALVFIRFGGRHYLKELRVRGHSVHAEFPIKHDREWLQARQTSTIETTVEVPL